MSKTNFIIPSKKTFNEDKDTFLLDIDKSVVDLSDIQGLADKNGFEQKDEFHITILGFKNGTAVKKTIKALPGTEGQITFEQIKVLAKEIDFSFAFEAQRYHITKDYVFRDPKNMGVELKERRESYIQMVNLPGMKIFYDRLNAILGTHFETPPAHITLYTKGNNEEKSKIGIGINTQDEFFKMNPELIS